MNKWILTIARICAFRLRKIEAAKQHLALNGAIFLSETTLEFADLFLHDRIFFTGVCLVKSVGLTQSYASTQNSTAHLTPEHAATKSSCALTSLVNIKPHNLSGMAHYTLGAMETLSQNL